MVANAAGHELRADAFKQLYPAQYYAGFLSKQLRPDGRQLSESRPTIIGIDTIKSADSSALVKTGSTTVVTGIKLEVRGVSSSVLPYLRPALTHCCGGHQKPTGLEDDPAQNSPLVINVEMATFGSADARPGRPSEAAQCICMQV